MARFVLSRNGNAQIVATSLRDFLLESPRGAYTVMRTIDNGRKIVCFDDHVRRLASSAESMLNQHQIERDSLSLRLLADIRSGITMMDNTSEDLTISILILTQGLDVGKPVPVWVYLAPFHHKHSISVAVEAMHASRKQFGTTKDSLWAKLRQDLLSAKHADVDEVVIIDDDGSVLEGLSSNVFVVNDDGLLQTTPISDGIVAGTIRQVLMAACESANVEIVKKAPSWKDRYRWRGAFLTSTSRLVLPIHEILDSVSGGDSVKFDAIADIVQMCGASTEANIEKHCRAIYD